jgi:hypothetical protein
MSGRATQFDLFLDESGLFQETSTDPIELAKSQQDWPSQLAGILAPCDEMTQEASAEILCVAFQASYQTFGPVVHGADLPSGRTFDALMEKLLSGLKQRKWQPVRMANRERVRYGDRVANYTNLVAELVVRIFRQKLIEGQPDLSLNVICERVALRKDERGQIEFLEQDEYKKRLDEAVARMAVRVGMAAESSRLRIEQVRLIRGKKCRELQVCDLLSNASYCDYRKCGPDLGSRLRKAFGLYDFSLSLREIADGRVIDFRGIFAQEIEFLGRHHAIDRIHRFLDEQDRGVLVLEAKPGWGKTSLMRHLVDAVFTEHDPRPVHFFYSRSAGIPDPDGFVRHVYASLLSIHGLAEAEEWSVQHNPEVAFQKLIDLLGERIASHVDRDHPQMILVDALDEARATVANRTAWDRLPDQGLPTGVYIIATTRPLAHPGALIRSPHRQRCDLEQPDWLQENLGDAAAYVERQLAGSPVPRDVVEELKRLGGGRFLVLDLACRHIRTLGEQESVREFLRRLATSRHEEQLGVVYDEFWQRTVDGVALKELNLLYDVIGVMLKARSPVTETMIRQALNLRPGDWSDAWARLAEYVAIISDPSEPRIARRYRLFHESFADYLRDRVLAPVDEDRFEAALANFCREWARYPHDYDREYAVRHAPTHLREAHRWEDLATLLTDLAFVRAKASLGLIHDLLTDYDAALSSWPDHHPYVPFGPQPQLVPGWLRECTAAVLDGRPDPHPDRGSGPALSRLRQPFQTDSGPAEPGPCHAVGELISVEHFGPDQGARATLAEIRRVRRLWRSGVDPYVTDHPTGRVQIFATFVAKVSHILQIDPDQILALARNHADAGPIVEQAERLSKELETPWFARDPRPPCPPARPACVKTLTEHGEEINAIALTPDGRFAAAAHSLPLGGGRSVIRVWDMTSGRCVRRLEGDLEGDPSPTHLGGT